MPYTIEDALDDDLVTVVEQNDETGHYVIKIGKLKTAVTIEMGRRRTSETTDYRISHAIHTPSQAGPYWTSLPHADYWAAALHKAINGLTSYYRNAIKDGHKPKESWLVER